MKKRSPKLRRSAVTLIEVLLVLAVLVMLASITWPALDRPMADQRLRKGAERVRTAWTKARIDAMSTGQTFVFRCTLESDEFSVESQTGPESVNTISSSTEGQFDETYESVEPTVTKTRHLPQDVRFVDGQVDVDTRATIFEDSSEISAPDSGQCLEPIYFFPDGTTSTATVVFENKYQRRIELSLRGLTGVVAVGDTYPAEDATRATQFQ